MYGASVVALHNRNWGAALAAFYNPQIKNIPGVLGGPAATLQDIWGTLEPFNWSPPESPEYAFPGMSERTRSALKRTLEACGHSDAVADLDETCGLLEYLMSLAVLTKYEGLQSYTKAIRDVAFEMRSNSSALLKYTNSGAVYPLLQAGFLGKNQGAYELASTKLAKLLEAKADWLLHVQ
jgi:hypothetical protein